MDKLDVIDYWELLQYFFNNFMRTKSVGEIKEYFRSRVVDITQEKEKQIPELALLNHQFIGQEHYDFRFVENSSYWGEISLDYVNEELRNVRCQLFANGIMANMFGLKQKFNKIYAFLINNLGNPTTLDFGVPHIPGVHIAQWIDEANSIFYSLSENTKQPNMRKYMSFSCEHMVKKVIIAEVTNKRK